MIKRLFLIAIFSILGFGIFAYLTNGQSDKFKPMSFEYFIETLSLLDIDFSSFKSALDFTSFNIDLVVNSWWNPFVVISAFIEGFIRIITLIYSFITDIFKFLSSLFIFFDKLVFAM